MRNLILSLTVAGSIVGLAAVASSGRSAAADEGGFKPVANPEILMENVGEAFDAVKDRIKEKDTKKLKKAKKEALFLAELLNVAGYYKGEKDWREWATKCRDLAKKLSDDCDQGDVKSLQEQYKALEAACEVCHKKYRDDK